MFTLFATVPFVRHQAKKRINSFPASGDFCHHYSDGIPESFFLKVNFEKVKQTTIKHARISWQELPSMHRVNPLYLGNPITSTFANSEDPDEMQHNAAFYQGLYCL